MNKTRSEKLPPDVLARLSERSDSKGATQLAAHLTLLVLAGFALHASLGTLWLLLTVPVYGTLLIFLFAPLHECIHYTAFRTRWLNDLVAAPIGFLLALPYRAFRQFHYAHHRHTQDPARDPELDGKQEWLERRYWLFLSGLPNWWQNLARIWRHARGRFDEAWIEQRHRNAIRLEARAHLATYGLLIGGSILLSSAAIWWYWILPALVAQPLLRLFLLPEHCGCDASDDMLANTRTTYTVPWVNFLAWNMPYHAEHHYLASVPFHALPALHAHVGARVKHKGDGYLRVNREIYAAQ